MGFNITTLQNTLLKCSSALAANIVVWPKSAKTLQKKQAYKTLFAF